MSIPYVTRRWLAPGGWDGPRFDADQVDAFSKLMREHGGKTKGTPALITSWYHGRSALCWYQARRGAEEREILRRCKVIFGCDPIPDAHEGV